MNDGAAAVLLFALVTASPPGSSVVGRVFMADGKEPVGFAYVVLVPVNGDGAPLMSSTTAGTLYHFDDVPDGEYRLQAVGSSNSVRLTVSARHTDTVDAFGRIVAPDLFVPSAQRMARSDVDVLDGHDGHSILGLLALPQLIVHPCGTETTSFIESTRGRMYFMAADRSPDGHSCAGSVLGVLGPSRAFEEVLTLERGPEEKAAVVLERSNQRLRVAMMTGSTWVEDNASMGFQPYPDLLVGHLAYLREGWDGTLRTRPGESGRSQRVSRQWLDYIADARDAPVEVLDIRVVSGRSWIHVRLDPEQCGERVPGVAAVTGWVPAYRPSGAASAWFYSRGC